MTVPRPAHRVTCSGSATAPVFGIDAAWAPRESERENVSIGAAETLLLRRLNRRLREAGLPSEEYRRLIRELVVHQTMARRPKMTKVTLPPDAYPWADEVAQEWIEWVQGSGIDVVGDVEDLRPVPPPETERWQDPDKPRRPEMVDAAIDAIVALALEAANRPIRTSSSALASAGRRGGCVPDDLRAGGVVVDPAPTARRQHAVAAVAQGSGSRIRTPGCRPGGPPPAPPSWSWYDDSPTAAGHCEGSRVWPTWCWAGPARGEDSPSSRCHGAARAHPASARPRSTRRRAPGRARAARGRRASPSCC